MGDVVAGDPVAIYADDFDASDAVLQQGGDVAVKNGRYWCFQFVNPPFGVGMGSQIVKKRRGDEQGNDEGNGRLFP